MVFVFVDIPAGTFQMGDHDGVGLDDERPVHMVTLDGFQMSKYETTNAQYVEYLNAAMARGLIRVVNDVVYASSDVGLAEPYCDTHGSSTYSQIVYRRDLFAVGSRHGKDMSDHPVVRVNWYGAKAFCDYYGFRLPTEAEWEYAAQGGYQDPYYSYPWGSETIDCSKANFQSDSGYCNPLDLSVPFTSLVGYYGPHGAYGLCDMSGNVWEWCQDWYNDSYYSVSPVNNPTGPIMGSYRVLRGGSCSSESNDCRVANRRVYVPYSRNSFDGVFGFRVCR
jgi:formylglycine-generating enzyme required for sulfatase activity